MGCAPCLWQNFEVLQWVWNAGDSNIAADVATTFCRPMWKLLCSFFPPYLSRLPKDPSPRLNENQAWNTFIINNNFKLWVAFTFYEPVLRSPGPACTFLLPYGENNACMWTELFFFSLTWMSGLACMHLD
jgi:hypothetical protein